MDGVVRLWDVETGEMQVALEGLSDSVEWVLCHPKGPVVFAGGAGGQSAMWNGKGECLQVFTGHGDCVACGSLTADTKQLITGSLDGTVRIFNPKTAETVFAFDKHKGLPDAGVLCLHASAQSEDTVLAGCADGSIAWLGVRTGKVLKVDKQHSGSVEAIESCPTLPMFATASTDGSVIVWDSVAQVPRHSTPSPDATIRVHWLGHSLLSCTSAGSIRMWDGRGPSTAEGPPREWLGHTGPIHDFTVSSCGRFLISAGDDTTCRVFGL
eukprot:TRINITY_DN1120_c0_g1_i2.p3 TRINITY_DN1120_c0_g1~~TRINITY_DN1120_c0_g1_i2.p3  ORF type:complete len:268 (+),score=62.25 TRINITY_DN1120_c0_g1_i2:499-1302(+)